MSIFSPAMYSATNCSKSWSAAYGIVHYKEPLKSFGIRVGHSPGFWRPFVAILHEYAENDVKKCTLTFPPQPCRNAPTHARGFGQI